MNKRQWYIGPGAASLILVIVVVSMGVLGLLALMNAKSDLSLAQRSSHFVQAQYETSAAAERALAELDTILLDCAGDTEAIASRLPEGMTLDGDTIRWVQDGGEGRDLSCAVRLCDGDERFVWTERVFVSDASDADQWE